MQITIDELLRRCDEAMGKMGTNNPHRETLAYCAQVLIQQGSLLVQQAEQIAQLQAAQPEKGVVLTDA